MNGRGYQVRFGPPQTPDAIKFLLVANGAVYILQYVFPSLTGWLAVSPAAVFEHYAFWQPATYMWLHSPGSILHILFNMYALWMFGSPVAAYWGEHRFMRFYLTCGIGAGVLIALWPAVPHWLGLPTPSSYWMPTLGASGAIFGVLLAYSLTWPDRQLMLLFPPIPIKAIWFIPLILALDFLSGPANVSHVGHIGGVLVGWLLLRRAGVAKPLDLARLRMNYKRWRMRRQLRAVGSDPWSRPPHRDGRGGDGRRDDDENPRHYH